ncbi:MAG: cbb3-type cytochrome c oxidase subunit II [Chthoniobacterales bacterium]
MKGLVPLLLGIFGTFAFSWAGLILIPNAQIGHLNPQMDEDGGDVYPAPRSGMAERGRKIYMANGCVYCHSQQVRPDYAASDIDRKWGERRSAPRDYIFDRPVLLGKMRVGPDLANVGKRAPAQDEAAPAPGATDAKTAAPAAPGGAPANPAATPASAPAGPTASPAPATAAASAPPPSGPSPASAPAAPSGSPARATAAASAPPAPGASPAAPVNAPAGAASPVPATGAQTAAAANPPTTNEVGHGPLQYSAGWHHQHLYDPRSLVPESTMPSFRFLYEKRQVSGEKAADAVNLTGPTGAASEYEIVPSYDAKCLVAYLMSLDQSHALKEVKSTSPASPPAPGKAAK